MYVLIIVIVLVLSLEELLKGHLGNFTVPPLWAVVLGISFNLLNILLVGFDKTVNYLADGAIPLV